MPIWPAAFSGDLTLFLQMSLAFQKAFELYGMCAGFNIHCSVVEKTNTKGWSPFLKYTGLSTGKKNNFPGLITSGVAQCIKKNGIAASIPGP